jgi:hypothetical protein
MSKSSVIAKRVMCGQKKGLRFIRLSTNTAFGGQCDAHAGRVIVFEGPPCRSVDPSILTESELCSLEKSHGFKIKRGPGAPLT